MEKIEIACGYIIWSPESDKPPTKVFAEKGEAIKIAYKCAQKFTGQRFFVCKLQGCAKTDTVTYTDLT